MQPDDVEIIARDTGYAGFYRLDRLLLRHRRFGGGWTAPLRREVVLHGASISVLPYDPLRDEVVLIEQFRVGALVAGRQPWTVELVGGMGEEGGESAEAIARRETREEAGLEIFALERIAGFMPSPGGSAEFMELFCARVDATHAGGLHGLAHEDEDIRVMRLPADAAIGMVGAGRIETAYTIIALQWLALNRAALRARWRETPAVVARS